MNVHMYIISEASNVSKINLKTFQSDGNRIRTIAADNSTYIPYQQVN